MSNESSEPRSESAENELLRRLTDFLARGIVAHPDEVQVEAVQSGRTLVLELAVAESDVGKVIGRQGKVIRALRTVVKAAATRQGTRVDIDVI
ncbi:MAG: KH domain-containing protein [Chloroflexota bacterium]